MHLKKYIEKADKLELATYKLALTCQINDTQATIDLIFQWEEDGLLEN